MNEKFIKLLQDQKIWNLSKFSRETGIGYNAVSLHANGKRKIGLKSALKYAEFFNVSIDKII